MKLGKQINKHRPKKSFFIHKLTILLLALVLCLTACAPGTPPDRPVLTDSAIAQMDGVLEDYGFKGIVSLSNDGTIIYQYIGGEDEDGAALTAESSMYIGSVSKQFCAAAILMLRDQGKLSVDDTLDRYFPEYEVGKNITLKQLLTMQAGIPDMVNEGPGDSLPYENTGAETIAAVKEWIFAQPLKFDPGTEYAYSNSNYFLLADIVEQVSGERYHDFIRENIFAPLGMERSGFVEEVRDDPSWAAGLARGEENGNIIQTGLANGAGDIVSNAADMAAWMAGLSNGTVLSADSFHEMCGADGATSYGYALKEMYRDGVGHPGAIDSYRALDYIHKESGYHLFIASNKSAVQNYIEALPAALLEPVFAEHNFD